MVHEVVPVVYTENRRLKGAIWLLKTALAVERTRVKKLQDDLNRKDIISLINGRVVQEVKKAPNHAPNHGYPYPSRTRGKIPAPYPSVNSWVGMGGYPDSQIHASPYAQCKTRAPISDPHVTQNFKGIEACILHGCTETQDILGDFGS
ncbi:hypothetical protein BT96DRAFT_1008433 [Gymnopus androsaceus JB14]|uniref:Uncharacterized protein n=1 Tax=Gymnopus androsaceus JB14 TaxID=1447944 RepID=A0A6A4GF84_9AGAR|nr:hypothetical protein BT96DRAFT_1008433 [Gymnopus androsaceus JB14]